MSEHTSDKNRVTAGLVIIGNEILSGRTQDANLSWLAGRLNEAGIQMVEARVIPDVEATIVATVNEMRARLDYLFTTGGIGPTHDDITAASIAAAFGVAIGRHAEAERRLLAHYGEAELTDARLKMAEIPDTATLIDNPVSAAPGFRIGNVFVMAGVPRIMQAMVDNILPTLRQGVTILSRTITCNLPESQIADELGVLQEQHPEIDIGSYPYFKMGFLGVSVVLRGADSDELDRIAVHVEEAILAKGGEIRPQDAPA